MRTILVTASLFSMFLVGQTLLADNPDCGLPIFATGAGPLDHSNVATLVVDQSTFPPELWAALDDALLSAMLDWNQSCETPPPANDYPVFKKALAPYSVPPGSKGEKTVSIVFSPGLGPGQSCQQFSNEICYPLATTWGDGEGRVTVTLWEKTGKTGNIVTIAWDALPHLDWLLKHELGHVLGLRDEQASLCNGSIMVGTFDDILDQGLGLISPDHCNRLQEMHDPPEPLEEAKNYDPINGCLSLFNYCQDGWLPWPKLRSRCVWVPHAVEVSSADSWGFVGATRVQYMSLECFWSFSWLQDGDPPVAHELIKTPTVAISAPNTPLVAPNAMLRVTGWAWANTHPLRQLTFWVDGVAVSSTGITTGLFKPEICQLGVDPGTCNPNSGFEGYLDVSGFNPGRHYLQVVATDQHPDPNPSFGELEFLIPSTTPNQGPVAVNDIATASIGLGTTHPIEIRVINNDSDPEGWPLRLPGNPFVSFPSKGLVRRLSDGTIEYTPLPNSSGSDSFQYKVEDSFGVPATATVNIQIMEGVFLP